MPEFAAQHIINGNAIAVFTAIGMCWSGYLSTHTAMLDALGYRKLTSKAILAHTVGGLVAGISAHWLFVLYTLAFGAPTTFEGGADRYTTAPVVIEFVSENQVKVGDRIFTDEAGDTPEEEGSLAQVIKAMLLEKDDELVIVDGKKVDVASVVDGEKLPAAPRESLEKEVLAAFEMYREELAEEKYGKALNEHTDEALKALDEATPFKVELVAEEQAVEEQTTEE